MNKFIVVVSVVLVFLTSCSSDFDHIKKIVADKNLAMCLIRNMKNNGTTDVEDVVELLCQSGVKNLSGLSRFYNLQRLYIQDNELEDLSSLGDLPALKIISVAGSKTMKSLSGLRMAPSLEELQANKVTLLKDIEEVAYLNELKVFAVLMADVNDVSALSNLHELTKVVLNYNSIEDLSPLGEKVKLEWLEAYSNPINNLDGLKNNANMKLFGIDKKLGGLCKEVDVIRHSLPQDSRVYGPECS